MTATPVLNGLLKYAEEGNISFHMPGHKNNRRGFKELEIIREKLYEMDNTEVPGLDNLHMPEEMIKELENKAAKIYRAEKSHICINGSTAGIYAMIMGTTRPGDKIIIQRNSHRAVFMACLLGNLETVYINPGYSDAFDIASVVETSKVIEVMEANLDAKAIVLTSPTYFGLCCDVEAIAKEAKKRGMLVLVDEAHGAHFPFSASMPVSALAAGADVSVTSIHKTLPALTQASLINIREESLDENIRFMLRLFQSTSPSYILMASIDAALEIGEREGEKLLAEVQDSIKSFKNKIAKFDEYKLLGIENIGDENVSSIDSTKLVISSVYGGVQLEEILRRNYNIQVEMCDINNIVLLAAMGNLKEDFDKLFEALKDIVEKNTNYMDRKKLIHKDISYEKKISLREAHYSNKKTIKLSEAVGCVSSEMAAPYPPGIPLLLPGEVITEKIVEALQYYKAAGIPINGVNDSKLEKIDVIVD